MKLLPDLKLPLRDLMRGAETLARSTDGLLAPAIELLPAAVRSRMRDARSRVRQVGRRLVASPLTKRQIAAAAGFVSGRRRDVSAAEACATVVGHAWEHLSAAPGQRPFISETMLAARLSRLAHAEAGNAARGAAEMVAALRHAPPARGMEAAGPADGQAECDELDLLLTAVAVWLLTERPASLAEEDRLLDLAVALVHAIRNDILPVVHDPRRLSPILADAAAHL